MEKWTIDNQDNYPDEYAICDDMGSLICTIPREDQYREQDAHLIAAAPELLDACKDALRSFRIIYDNLEEDHELTGMDCWPLSELREAIAKAEPQP